MRPDMFPKELVIAMSKLRQDVPSHSFTHTRRMIKESFGRDVEELFLEFDETPVASGTVAQVHRAVLRPEFAVNGEQQVAVKVRHPSVLEETFVDIPIIFRVMDNIDLMTMPFSKDQFLTNIQRQINFEWEAYSLAKYAQDFRKEIEKGEVSFPCVNTTLLSPSVLVESWAAGHSVATYFAEVGDSFKMIASDAKAAGQRLVNSIDTQRREIAERTFSVCMKMFLRDNHMHGDLHAGNVLYHKDSQTLTVLDAGCTTCLTNESAADFGRFMHGLCTGNANEVVTSLVNFSDVPVNDLPAFKADIDKSVRRWVAADGRAHDGSPVCIGDLVGDILFKLGRYNIQLRGDVAASIMSIAVSEGLIRQLDPDFDMNMRALPYLAKYGFPGGVVSA